MKKYLLLCSLFIFIALMGCTNESIASTPAASVSPTGELIKLPSPQIKGTVSLEEAIKNRRSIREYADLPLALSEISQLLWAAQGITSESGGRSAPSAGALYPLEVYLVVGNVQNLAIGIYRYIPAEHAVYRIKDNDARAELAKVALSQAAVSDGAIDIVITAVYERLASRYGERATRYAQLEAGHAAQNVCLEATALNLGSVTIGAFDDSQVRNVLDAPANETPLYIIPVGKKP